MIARIKTYYSLTKPGIIFGNIVTALGGFFLSISTQMSLSLLLPCMLGLSCIIAAGCVANNYQDRFFDAHMKRTRLRALVQQTVTPGQALFFTVSLLLCGSVLLACYTNTLAWLVALAGFSVYVFLYTPIKQRSPHATLIGSIAGATPPLVGYCAVHNCADMGGILLFILTMLWQMPHFFAISLYRLEDYTQASLPVLPVEKGVRHTKSQITLYLLAFVCLPPLLFLFHYANLTFLVFTSLCSAAWLLLCLKGWTSSKDTLWAKQMFLFSLIAITLLNTLLIGAGCIKICSG